MKRNWKRWVSSKRRIPLLSSIASLEFLEQVKITGGVQQKGKGDQAWAVTRDIPVESKWWSSGISVLVVSQWSRFLRSGWVMPFHGDIQNSDGYMATCCGFGLILEVGLDQMVSRDPFKSKSVWFYLSKSVWFYLSYLHGLVAHVVIFALVISPGTDSVR